MITMPASLSGLVNIISLFACNSFRHFKWSGVANPRFARLSCRCWWIELKREDLSFSNSCEADGTKSDSWKKYLIVWFYWTGSWISVLTIGRQANRWQALGESLRIQGELTTRWVWIDGFFQRWLHSLQLFLHYWMVAGDEPFPFFSGHLIEDLRRIHKISLPLGYPTDYGTSLVRGLAT